MMTKNINFRLIGMIIGELVILIKLIDLIVFFSSILGWWHGEYYKMYFVSYILSILTMTSSLLPEKKSSIISVIAICILLLLIFGDGIMFLGFVMSLDHALLMEKGIMPICNILLIIANVLILIGNNKMPKKSIKLGSLSSSVGGPKTMSNESK